MGVAVDLAGGGAIEREGGGADCCNGVDWGGWV